MRKNFSGTRIAIAFMLGFAGSALAQERLQRVVMPNSVPDVVLRSADLGIANPDLVLHVAVSLPYADPAGMAAFVDSVSDPKSPNYRHFLTPEEVGARFGLSEQQVQSVVDHLKASGANVTLVGKNRLSILAECTAAQAEKAFNTTIHDYQTINANEPGNARYHANNSEVTLPAAIAPYVIDVAGLESFTKPQHRILNPTQTRTLDGVAPFYSAGTQGQGRTVAISNWDGFRLTNVPLYYAQYGLPTPPGGVGSNITVVTVGGGSGSGTPQGEADLDIQMVLGMAPLCNLRIYDGAGSNLIAVLTQEVNDNAADVISESWGWSISSSTATSAHNLHLSMSAQGITYMAASGDSGTSLEPYSYPDYDPEVLSVGGTIATVNGSGNRTSEVGWSGSGGGWSTTVASFNVLPSWQHGTGVPTTPNKRLVPDVALNASGTGGAYYFYFNGSLSGGSVGTSFASPVFAGSLAVAEQQIIALGGLPPDGAGKRRMGRIQDVIYAQNGRSDIWFDVTSGNNGTLPSGGSSSAGAGWDFVTGWGAINFNTFASVVANAPCVGPSIASNPNNATVCNGGQATFDFAASGSTPMTFQWRRGTTNLSNGVNISGANTSSLTINAAGPADAASDYNCVATNSCGSATSANVTLTVNTGAAIVTQPPATLNKCQDGTSFTISVVASGSPAPTYQWLKNNVSISGATNSTYTSPAPATSADNGIYRCTVTNSCGIAPSNECTVTVSPLGGDINGDGTTNSVDLGILFNNFGHTVTPGTNGDFTGDGVVNSIDLGILLTNFGLHC